MTGRCCISVNCHCQVGLSQFLERNQILATWLHLHLRGGVICLDQISMAIHPDMSNLNHSQLACCNNKCLNALRNADLNAGHPRGLVRRSPGAVTPLPLLGRPALIVASHPVMSSRASAQYHVSRKFAPWKFQGSCRCLHAPATFIIPSLNPDV